MFNRIKLLKDIKEECKKQDNKSFPIIIRKDDYPKLKLNDIEYLIEHGYLQCNEEKGKAVTFDGNWQIVCQLTYKTLAYRKYMILDFLKSLGSFGGLITILNFIKNIFTSLMN